MTIETFISIDVNKNIRRVGGDHSTTPEYFTVLELHRFLQGLADNESESGDDLISIIRKDPSSKSTDNIIELLDVYNIDDDLAEYLYDGSIIQATGSTIYDGFVNFGNTTFIDILQNGTLLVNDYWNENGGLNPDPVSGISHRFMLKVRDSGSDIDGRRILGLTRNFGFTYGEFPVNGTSRGNNVLALSQSADLNNQTAGGTVATWTDIVNNNEGFSVLDLNNGNGPRSYYSEWDYGSRSVKNFYERLKWLTRQGTSETLYGLSGGVFRGITHQIDIDNPTGTFVEPEPISWAGGTGQLLAIDSVTAGTKMWIQLLTGTAPSDGVSITGNGGATADVNATVTGRTISAPFVGQSTGTAILGSYGLGIESSDLTVSDSLTDLTDTVQSPPNQQSFTVSGVVSGEDRILVGPINSTSDNVDFEQLTANGAQGTAATTFVVNEVIPTDTPASGTIRVFDGTSHQIVNYNSYTASTFQLSTTLGHSIADDAGAFVSYIDTLASSTAESFTYIYSGSDINLYVKVRDGGGSPIKSFETSATAGSAGGSVTAIRTSDS